jgi:hypothetical protein
MIDAIEILLEDKPHVQAQKLLSFHRENQDFLPRIVAEFRLLKRLGRKKAGAKAVAHFLRWEHDWQGIDQFEINDHLSSLAVRVCTLLWPDISGMARFYQCVADNILGTRIVARPKGCGNFLCPTERTLNGRGVFLAVRTDGVGRVRPIQLDRIVIPPPVPVLDRPAIRAWWERWPKANVAIATGASKLTVIDIDHGIACWENLADWAVPRGLSLTYAVRTGRRPEYGVQLYYQGEGVKSIAWVDGELSGDIRGATGYVMAAGCIHPDSKEAYELLCDKPIAPVPEFILRLPPAPKTGAPGNSRLGKKRSEGADDDAIEAYAHEVNETRQESLRRQHFAVKGGALRHLDEGRFRIQLNMQFLVFQPHHCGFVDPVLVSEFLGAPKNDIGVGHQPIALARAGILRNILFDWAERFIAAPPKFDSHNPAATTLEGAIAAGGKSFRASRPRST